MYGKKINYTEENVKKESQRKKSAGKITFALKILLKEICSRFSSEDTLVKTCGESLWTETNLFGCLFRLGP